MANNNGPHTGQRFVYATVWTLVHFLLRGVLFYGALVVVPDDMRSFEEFDTELPVMTILVIDVSLLIRKYWYLAALLGLIALGLDWLILSILGKPGRIRVIIIGILFALIPLLLGTMAFLSMQLGWTKLEADLTMAG